MQEEAVKGDVLQRIAGVSLIVGAIVLIVFNALFPRVGDPSVTRDVLTNYGGNETLTQVAYLGIAIGMWLLLAGLAGVYRSLSFGVAAAWARVRFYGIIVGTTMWTVTSAIGLATAGAAASWLAVSGTLGEATSFSIAATLNAAGTALFTVTVLVYSTALAILSIGIGFGTVYPKLLGWVSIVLGVVTAIIIIPQAFTGVTQISQILFAIFAGLTTLWALALGLLITRRQMKLI